MSCFHCGLPVPASGRHVSWLLGAEREFCCAGCEAVARTIVDGGFEGYYRTRTANPSPPRAAAALELENRGKASLILEGLRCTACSWLIEQVLKRETGVRRAAVNYATGRAQLEWDVSLTRLDQLIAAVRAVGYDAVPYDPQRQDEARRRERRAALGRLFIAAFGAMQVMMYAFPAYVSEGELSLEAEAMMRWASLLLTLPVLVVACRPFFAGALRELASRRIGLETPIALGLAGGFAASAWATFTGAGEVYFDSIAMLAFLLLAARYAHLLAAQRASAMLDRLMRWTPSADLKIDQRITVAPGERIPADGVVEQGASSADESLLTGESRPVPKASGSQVVAGSVNLDQPLTIRVTRAGGDTQAAAIARLAERAAGEKPRLVEAADRIGRHLTLVVLLVAAGGALYWGNAWIAVAVLVATCPCALGLAAPIVLTRANAHLLARGALVTRSSAHAALARVTDVVLDKTGTLTAGKLTLSRVTPLGRRDDEACLLLARSLEASSRHPVARAFGSGLVVDIEGPRNAPGEGIEALVDGRRMRIGSASFCEALASAPAPMQARVFLAAEQEWIAAFELHDAVRPEAAALVQALRERRREVHLASGDRPQAAEALSRLLGIERFSGAMSPQDKADYVQRLQREGRVVAMIGDGLNDTPVLARADVSFAMGGGADAAQLGSDVVLTGERLGGVHDVLDTSRRAMRLIRQNFAWAIAYNAAVLPLAALGLIGPWEAAIGMAASSIAVVLNASRPLQPGKPWKASTSSSRSPSLSYS